VGGHAPKPKLTAALEELVDREVALEDQVAAVLDLQVMGSDLQVMGSGLVQCIK
jgi:hypothetical protein